MINLLGKTVLITGGSRGIGKSCVKLFFKAGANVAFTYKNSQKESELLTNELNKNTFSNIVHAYKCNIENEKEIIDCIKDIVRKFNKIDILVNNAGIWKYGECDKMSLNEWEETLKINLTSYFLFTREVVPVMKQNKYGRIINISSTAGQRGEAYHSHYAASKGAIISFTKSLSTELADYNILVNCVAPGWVDTDMCKEVFADSEFKEKIRKTIPIGKILTPDQIAGSVLFLASELSDCITGEILNVNGGSVLCG